MAQLPNMYGRAHEMLGLLGLIRYSFVVFVVGCKKAEEGGEVRQANTSIIVDLKKITVCAAPGTCTCTRPGLCNASATEPVNPSCCPRDVSAEVLHEFVKWMGQLTSNEPISTRTCAAFFLPVSIVCLIVIPQSQ